MTSPERVAQVVFADTSAAECPETHGVRVPMRVPSQRAENGEEKTVGGFMTVPLLGFVVDGRPRRLANVSWLMIDTGSTSFFVLDATEGAGGKSALEEASFFADGCVGQCGFLIGDPKGHAVFELSLPEQWRRYPDEDPELFAKQRPQAVPSRGLNFLVVGAAWLHAVAVTFEPSRRLPDGGRGAVLFSHLDGRGRRVGRYVGPASERTPRRPHGPTLLAVPQQRGFVGGRYSGPSLASVGLVAAGASPDAPKHSDLVVDLVWMAEPSAQEAALLRRRKGRAPLSLQTKRPDRLALPSLEARVRVRTADGERAHAVAFVVDTGSGVNLAANLDAIPEPGGDCRPGRCACVGGGKVKDIWAQSASFRGGPGRFRNDAGAGTGSFADDARSAACAPCCSTCLLGGGLTPESDVQCSLSYCTGVQAYAPRIVRAALPRARLARETSAGQPELDVRVFLGKASAVCHPIYRLGIWGAWLWTQPTEARDGRPSDHASTLPHYVLAHLNQLDDERLNNVTFRFWRTDLPAVPSAFPLLPPLLEPPSAEATPWAEPWPSATPQPADGAQEPWPQPSHAAAEASQTTRVEKDAPPWPSVAPHHDEAPRRPTSEAARGPGETAQGNGGVNVVVNNTIQGPTSDAASPIALAAAILACCAAALLFWAVAKSR